MDFNTGRDSGRSDDRPLFGGDTDRPTGRPPRGPAGGPGGEFNLQDPVNSFIGAVRNVVLDPVGFFRGIARRGDFINPLVFALICYEIFTFLSGLLALAGISGVGRGIGEFIVSLILAPIFGAIGVFIGAGILHLLVLLLVRPSNAGFEATFRVSCYSAVATLVSWIPIIGIIGLYGLYIATMGIREMHATTTGRAALIVLIPVAVVVLFLVLVLVLLGAVLFFGSQQRF